MEIDTPTEKTELKPCPFCGGEAELQPEGLTACGYWVKCSECGIEQSETCEFAEDAIEVWNRRVHDD